MAGSLPERVDALFSAGINVWQDRRTVQCEIRYLAPSNASRAFLERCAGEENGFFRAICEQILYNNSVHLPEHPAEHEPPPARMLGTDALDQAIRSAVEADAQGTLLVAHTLSALRKWTVRLALMRAEFQYSIGLPGDCRAFNALCAAPSFAPGAKPVQYARVALLDGALNEGELAAWQALYPRAEILCDSGAATQILRTALAPHVPDDEAMRAVYKALRNAPPSLAALAEEARCTEPAACAALCVLQELELVEWQPTPWQVALLPPRKSSLEDSMLLRALRGMAEG